MHAVVCQQRLAPVQARSRVFVPAQEGGVPGECCDAGRVWIPLRSHVNYDRTVTEFDSQDVVRHHLVGRIILAYDRYEAAQAADEELARQDREERQAERRFQQVRRREEGRVR